MDAFGAAEFKMLAREHMDKANFRGTLQTIKNNYALVQAGIMFLAQPDSLNKFDEYSSPFVDHPEGSQFIYIRYVLENDHLLGHATNQLRKSVLRNCIREMFELVKIYGEETNQMAVMRAAPWYQFLRMIRNSLSHDYFLRFRAHDLKLLPITWSGLTIDASMADIELPMANFLSRTKILELMDDVIAYTDKNVG